MSRFLKQTLRARHRALETYAHRVPGKCDLSLISGPFIWADEVTRALAGTGEEELRGYAAPAQDPRLLEELAAWEGVDRESIWLTPGADQAVEGVLERCLETGDTLAVVVPNFPRFAVVAAGIPGLRTVEVESLAEVPAEARMVAVCTPNNPSTRALATGELRRHIAARPDMLFCVDGVFDWYGCGDLAGLCRDHDNVVVLKSFSKIGLAGLRLGYIVGAPDTVAGIQRGLSPFCVPRIVQNIGREVAKSLDRLDELRALLESRFVTIQAALGDAAVRESPVPFYLLRTRIDSGEAVTQLAAAGISVVDGRHFSGLSANRLRVAIGNPAENELLIRNVRRLGIVD